MRLHITMLYGIGHTSAAAIAMKNVVNIAKQMGANELGLYKYPVSSDSDRDLSVRMDGILASIWHEDIVIFQHPSWNDLRYEETFIRKVKYYSGTKLIIFVHDIIPLMMNMDEEHLKECITLYNKADLLILPSKNMHDFLMEKGLLVNKVIYQEVWDYPIEVHEIPAVFERKLHFLGSAERFPFIKEWNGKSTIELYGNEKFSDDPRFVFNEQMKSDLLVHKISQRGFGLVWSGDEQIEYGRLNQPFKLGTLLAACVPIIIQRGMAAADFVEKNGVGFVVTSLEEADEIVQNISEKEYWELFEKVKKVQFLASNGYYTRKIINDALIKLLDEENIEINVIDNYATLEWVLKNQSSVVRLGDGEFSIICGYGIPYQEFDPELASKLKNILMQPSSKKEIICIPDVFERKYRYNDYCNNFWNNYLKSHSDLCKSLLKSEWYGSTFFSRPYIDLKDKSQATGYFEKLKCLWKNREIVIVEGENSRSGVGNDLFDNASAISRIICPSCNAYSKYEKIKNAIRQYGNGKLILVMLGPTAKILVHELSEENYWMIDMGHIDSEYEWYKQGAETKVKLPNKHTAEHNYDENIVLEYDEEYEKQIVYKIK